MKPKPEKKHHSVRGCGVMEVVGDGGATLSSLLIQSRPMQHELLQVNQSGHCHVRHRKNKKNAMTLYTESLTSNLEHIRNGLQEGPVGQHKWFS